MRKAAEPIEDKTVLLSIHDITPAHEDDVVHTYDELCDLGITSFTLLVTPFYRMKKSNTFMRGSPFTEFLLSLELEISLHGYSHYTKSGAMNEFSNISSDRARSRIQDGISLVRKSFGQRPVGFVAPEWNSPPRVVKAAREAKLVYSVEGNNIHRSSDQSIFSSAEWIVGQGQRTINTEDAIFEIELGGALQIAIHPLDHRMNNLLELVTDLKDRQDYRFLSYRDFLSEKI